MSCPAIDAAKTVVTPIFGMKKITDETKIAPSKPPANTYHGAVFKCPQFGISVLNMKFNARSAKKPTKKLIKAPCIGCFK